MHRDLVLPGSDNIKRPNKERGANKEENFEVQEIKILISAQNMILDLCNKKLIKLNEEKNGLERDLERVINELSEREKIIKMEKKEVQIDSDEDKKLAQEFEILSKKHEKLVNEKVLVGNQRIKTEHDLESMEKANELASKSLEKLIKWEHWVNSLIKS